MPESWTIAPILRFGPVYAIDRRDGVEIHLGRARPDRRALGPLWRWSIVGGKQLLFGSADEPFVGYVPEPGAGLLLSTGLLGLAGWRRRAHGRGLSSAKRGVPAAVAPSSVNC